MVKGNAGDIELRALEREVKIQREQLDTALGRVREAEGAAPAEARIVSRAVAPSVPSFPQKLPIVGFVTLLTLLLSLGGVLARTLRGKPAKAALPETRPEEAETVTPVAANPFLFPEAMPAKDWAEPVAAEAEAQPEPVAEAETVEVEPVMEAEPAPVAAPVAVAVPADGFDLTPLIERLSRRPVIAGAPEGRMVVLMETDQAAMPALTGALASAFGRDGSVLVVDLAGPDGASEQAGFTDVVCGDADFVEAIQADGPGGAHHVAAGIAPAGLLFEEPRALAFTLEAMAEAYEWVICRLRPQPEAAELLSLVATLADSVVIASNADPADETLADLYATALEAGAGQVLIAQDRPNAEPPAEQHEDIVFPEFHLKAA